MLKSTLFILLLTCTITFSAPTKESENVKDLHYAAGEKFKDVTVENLTPEQLKIIQNGAQKFNVTIDDILLYIRLSAENVPLLQSIKAQVSKHVDIFRQMTNEITEFNDPKEVSSEDLLKNHPELMDKLVKELNATDDEILYLTRFMIIAEHNKGQGFEDIVRKMQRETTLCPVPPDVVRENTSSDEIQKYIRQMLSLDITPNMTLPLQMVKNVERFCLIPNSLFGVNTVWEKFSILSEAD